jgi:hypothetical protein
MCLPWTLVAMGLQRYSCRLFSLNKSTTVVIGNGNGYTSAIMINTTNTFDGYSLGFIASPTILSSLLPLMPLYPVAEYGLCNNHQLQQWLVINHVVTTYISLLLPTSALSAKKLTGSLIFCSRIWCKTCQFTCGTDMPCMDSYIEEFAKRITGEVIWWHQRCIVCKKLCRKNVNWALNRCITVLEHY